MGEDLEKILAGPEYFYCQRFRARMKMSECARRQGADGQEIENIGLDACVDCDQGRDIMKILSSLAEPAKKETTTDPHGAVADPGNETPAKPRCKGFWGDEPCMNDVVAEGYCSGHYARLKRGQNINAPNKRTSRDGFCRIEGCDRPIFRKQLCSSHYYREYRAKKALENKNKPEMAAVIEPIEININPGLPSQVEIPAATVTAEVGEGETRLREIVKETGEALSGHFQGRWHNLLEEKPEHVERQIGPMEMLVDFTGREGLFQALSRMAREEFRDVQGQALACIDQAARRKGHLRGDDD